MLVWVQKTPHVAEKEQVRPLETRLTAEYSGSRPERSHLSQWRRRRRSKRRTWGQKKRGDACQGDTGGLFLNNCRWCTCDSIWARVLGHWLHQTKGYRHLNPVGHLPALERRHSAHQWLLCLWKGACSEKRNRTRPSVNYDLANFSSFLVCSGLGKGIAYRNEYHGAVNNHFPVY